jgi:hypothetical protein
MTSGKIALDACAMKFFDALAVAIRKGTSKNKLGADSVWFWNDYRFHSV